MKIWTEPRVTLYATTGIENSFPYKFETDAEEDTEEIVEASGRLCYMSFGKDVEADGHKTVQGRVGNAAYLKNIIDSKHGSVLEHANFTVLIEGVSRSLTHELVRHRHFSYSQLSQRYVEESDVGFVIPPEILKSDTDMRVVWEDMCSEVLDNYNELLKMISVRLEDIDLSAREKNKRIRQTARSVLPNCTETKIVMTGNARAWIHFFNLRGSIHADTEIRRLACEIFELLYNHSPNLFQNIVHYPQQGTLTVEGGSI